MFQDFRNQTSDVFRGLAHRILPERVPLFPKTEKEFCDLLAERVRSGKEVLVVISVRATHEDTSGGWGFMELKNCELVCEAAIGLKERITFVRELFTRYRTENVVNINDEKQCKTIGFVGAGLQRKRILDRMPQAEVHIMAGERPLTLEGIINIVGNAEIYELKLREVAKLFGDDSDSTPTPGAEASDALIMFSVNP